MDIVIAIPQTLTLTHTDTDINIYTRICTYQIDSILEDIVNLQTLLYNLNINVNYYQH